MIKKYSTIIKEKRIYSLNPFGSKRDFVIWLFVILFSLGTVSGLSLFILQDRGMAIGAFFGGLIGIFFMRIMMIPIIGQISNSNKCDLNNRLNSLGYCRSYVDREGATIIFRDVAHWLRWDADQLKIQRESDSMLSVIGPLAIMRKL